MDSVQKRKLIILCLLTAGAVISLSWGLFAPTKKEPETAPQQATAPHIPILTITRQAAQSQFKEWGKDPFASEKKQETSEIPLTLNGISWDEATPMALINDEIVHKGDRLLDGKIEVIDIQKDRVILNNGKTNFELLLETE